MKKIIIAICTLISLVSQGQVKQKLGTYGVETRRMKVDSAIQIPTFQVGVKNQYIGFDTAQMYYNPIDSSVYVHTGTAWRLIKGSGGTTPTWQQSLTTGSTLVGNNLVINNDDFHIRTVGVGDEWKSIYKVSDAATDSSYIGVRRGSTPLAEAYSVVSGITYVFRAGISAIDVLAQRGGDEFSIYEGFADSLRLTAGQTAIIGGPESAMVLSRDSIKIRPQLGQINIDTLRTWNNVADTLYKKPMTWDTRNGRWEYASNWFSSGGGGGSGLTVGTTAITSGTVGRVLYEGAGNLLAESSSMVFDGTIFTAGAVVSQTYIDGTSIRCDGSEVFNTSSLELDMGSGGGFTSAKIVSGANARIGLGGNTSSFPGLQRSGANMMVVFADGSQGANLSIGGTPVASAALTVTSTTQGLLLPRMTKTQRDAIASPVAGLAIYQTDNTPGLRVFNGTNWMKYTEATD